MYITTRKDHCLCLLCVIQNVSFFFSSNIECLLKTILFWHCKCLFNANGFLNGLHVYVHRMYVKYKPYQITNWSQWIEAMASASKVKIEIGYRQNQGKDIFIHGFADVIVSINIKCKFSGPSLYTEILKWCFFIWILSCFFYMLCDVRVRMRIRSIFSECEIG